jgi:hypothetical protein
MNTQAKGEMSVMEMKSATLLSKEGRVVHRLQVPKFTYVIRYDDRYYAFTAREFYTEAPLYWVGAQEFNPYWLFATNVEAQGVSGMENFTGAFPRFKDAMAAGFALQEGVEVPSFTIVDIRNNKRFFKQVGPSVGGIGLWSDGRK